METTLPEIFVNARIPDRCSISAEKNGSLQEKYSLAKELWQGAQKGRFYPVFHRTASHFQEAAAGILPAPDGYRRERFHLQPLRHDHG
jgi:hypothetical protein